MKVRIKNVELSYRELREIVQAKLLADGVITKNEKVTKSEVGLWFIDFTIETIERET